MAPNDPISIESGEKGNVNLIYILYLVAIAFGVTAIIGVVMAYMGRDKAEPWLRSHYVNQIHIFWKALLYSVIGLVLTTVLIGFFVLLGVLIWYIVRIIKGMQHLARGEPYPMPASWWL